MCVTLSCPLSRNLLSCVPTEVPTLSIQTFPVHIWWGRQPSWRACAKSLSPACRRLAVAMRAAATGARREGGGLTFSSSVCVTVLLLHCLLYQLSEGGWRSSSMAAVATAPTLPSPTRRPEWRQAGCGNKCLLGEWLWFLLGLQWHWESTLF